MVIISDYNSACCYKFQLLGLGLIVAGVYAYIELRTYLDLFGNEALNAPAIVLIAFGCITFIIAAIGCIGACKESSCLLLTVSSADTIGHGLSTSSNSLDYVLNYCH